MISIIMCSVDEAKFAEAAASLGARLTPESFELVRIPDAKSLAEGYNRGIDRAKGDLLIFCHDDIEIFADNLHGKLQHTLQTADIVGVAGTDRLVAGTWTAAGAPHLFGQVAHHVPGAEFPYMVDIYNAPSREIANICAMDGLFLAGRRAAVEQIRFDAETFDGFHLYDLDFTFRAHLAGLKLAIRCDLAIVHRSAGDYGDSWEEYHKRFNTKFATKLSTIAFDRRFHWTRVGVKAREDALAIMKPANWNSE